MEISEKAVTSIFIEGINKTWQRWLLYEHLSSSPMHNPSIPFTGELWNSCKIQYQTNTVKKNWKLEKHRFQSLTNLPSVIEAVKSKIIYEIIFSAEKVADIYLYFTLKFIVRERGSVVIMEWAWKKLRELMFLHLNIYILLQRGEKY